MKERFQGVIVITIIRSDQRIVVTIGKNHEPLVVPAGPVIKPLTMGGIDCVIVLRMQDEK